MFAVTYLKNHDFIIILCNSAILYQLWGMRNREFNTLSFNFNFIKVTILTFRKIKDFKIREGCMFRLYADITLCI